MDQRIKQARRQHGRDQRQKAHWVVFQRGGHQPEQQECPGKQECRRDNGDQRFICDIKLCRNCRAGRIGHQIDDLKAPHRGVEDNVLNGAKYDQDNHGTDGKADPAPADRAPERSVRPGKGQAENVVPGQAEQADRCDQERSEQQARCRA